MSSASPPPTKDESSRGPALICASRLRAGLHELLRNGLVPPEAARKSVQLWLSDCLEAPFRLELIIAYIQILYTS